MTLTSTQERSYTRVWKHFFVNRTWLDRLTTKGYKVSFVGADLVVLLSSMRDTRLNPSSERPLYIDLRITRPVAERYHALTAHCNYSRMGDQEEELQDELRDTKCFSATLQDGVLATRQTLNLEWSEYQNGTEVPNWVVLSITGGIHHETAPAFGGLPELSVSLPADKRSWQAWVQRDGQTGKRKHVHASVCLSADTPVDWNPLAPNRQDHHWPILMIIHDPLRIGVRLMRYVASYDCRQMLVARGMLMR